MGIPPTGKQVTISETHISRIAGGKVAERWSQWDTLGMLQQLGAIPAPGQ
jgi:predicted ester cyclase